MTIPLFQESNQLVLERPNFFSCVNFSSHYIQDTSKINCISRIDDKDKNLFVQENRKGRWNLYAQIVIENGTLRCAKESYPLTDLCNDCVEPQPCTLQDTNEIVNIGMDYEM